MIAGAFRRYNKIEDADAITKHGRVNQSKNRKKNKSRLRSKTCSIRCFFFLNRIRTRVSKVCLRHERPPIKLWYYIDVHTPQTVHLVYLNLISKMMLKKKSNFYDLLSASLHGKKLDNGPHHMMTKKNVGRK